jgi:hypothetical protein
MNFWKKIPPGILENLDVTMPLGDIHSCTYANHYGGARNYCTAAPVRKFLYFLTCLQENY